MNSNFFSENYGDGLSIFLSLGIGADFKVTYTEFHPEIKYPFAV